MSEKLCSHCEHLQSRHKTEHWWSKVLYACQEILASGKPCSCMVSDMNALKRIEVG